MIPATTRRCLHVAAIALLIAVACSPSEAPRTSADESPGPRAATPRVAIPRVRDEIADDPELDGWRSEAVATVVSMSLNRLAAVIARGADSGANDLDDLAARDFVTNTAVSGAPRRLYETAAFAVEDLLASDGNATQESGPGRLARLCNALAGACGDDVEAHFKIVGIELGEGECSTRILASMHSAADGGRCQIDATFSARWLLDGERARMRGAEFESLRRVTSRGQVFTDVTADVLSGCPEARDQLARGTGQWLSSIETAAGVDFLGHSGIAVGDIDGDGLDDIHVSQPGGLPNRLLRQLADGRVEDVSARSGTDLLDRTTGALLVDLDDDGDPELVVATREALLVMENDGRGRFSVAATLRSPLAWSLTASDFDGDGDLDLYAPSYFGRALDGDGFPSPNPFHDAVNGGRNILWRNDGDWKFSDVTEQVGLDVDNSRFTFAAGWEDHDGDGDSDLHVVNDFGSNKLYRNDGGRFVDVTEAAGADDRNFGMSITFGDHDRDGAADAYISNMFSSAGNRVVPQPAFKPGVPSAIRDRFLGLASGNTLLTNTADGRYRDVSRRAGVSMARWAWGARFCDVDNDGWEDLLVCNGYVSSPGTGDL